MNKAVSVAVIDKRMALVVMDDGRLFRATRINENVNPQWTQLALPQLPVAADPAPEPAPAPLPPPVETTSDTTADDTTTEEAHELPETPETAEKVPAKRSRKKADSD